MAQENETMIDETVYAFSSATRAKAFEECLDGGELSSCKEAWQPTPFILLRNLTYLPTRTANLFLNRKVRPLRWR